MSIAIDPNCFPTRIARVGRHVDRGEWASGHAILAAAVGVVLASDTAGTPLPPLVTRSPSANGATRQWSSVDDFVREVGESRIYAGIHFRHAVRDGRRQGRSIGASVSQALPAAR